MKYRELPSINLIISDFGFTWCPTKYFSSPHPDFPSLPALVEQKIFATHLSGLWLRGDLCTSEIARILSEGIHLSPHQVKTYMRQTVRGLPVNPSIRNFISEQRLAGRKTAMVTINSDLFSEEIVRDQQLWQYFDIIINSADYKTTDKEYLWNIALSVLGAEYSYKTSLLIDDEERWTQRFQALGGRAFRWACDEDFAKWVSMVWPRMLGGH